MLLKYAAPPDVESQTWKLPADDLVNECESLEMKTRLWDMGDSCTIVEVKKDWADS